MFNTFELTEVSEQDCKYFAQLLTDLYLKQLGFRVFLGYEYVSVNRKDGQIVIEIKTDKRSLNDNTSWVPVNLTLFLDKFSCVKILADPRSVAFYLDNEKITEIWRTYLLNHYSEDYDYEEQLMQYFADTRAEYLKKKDKQMREKWEMYKLVGKNKKTSCNRTSLGC